MKVDRAEVCGCVKSGKEGYSTIGLAVYGRGNTMY